MVSKKNQPEYDVVEEEIIAKPVRNSCICTRESKSLECPEHS